MCLIMSDRAALRAAKLLRQYPDACGMHDVDKLASAGVGTLVRKDGRGGVINPFPEGQKLWPCKEISSAQKRGTGGACALGSGCTCIQDWERC